MLIQTFMHVYILVNIFHREILMQTIFVFEKALQISYIFHCKQTELEKFDTV